MIEEAAKGRSAADIYDLVTKEHGPGVISRRTVTTIRSEVIARSDEEPWSISDEEDPEALRLVAQTLGDLIFETRGRTRTISRHQARWIARLRRLDPDMSTLQAFELAARYVFAERNDDPELRARTDLTVLLRTWASEDRRSLHATLAAGLSVEALG